MQVKDMKEKRLLRAFLSGLLFIIVIACPGAGFGFDQPWDSGHNTTNVGPNGPNNPPNGPNGPNGGDPVNLSSGNFAFNELDILIPGTGFNLEIFRFYNSQDLYNGPFGYGWHFVPFMNLIEVVKGTERRIIIKRGDGVRLEFTDNGDGTYASQNGWYYSLSDKSGGGYNFKETGGNVSVFDAAGKLQTMTDRSGNQLSFGYNTNGQLISITDPSARQLTLTYGLNGKISTVTDFAGRVYTYAYDALDNLVSVIDPLNNAKTYAYDSDHHLLGITDADSVALIQNTYNSLGKVLTQSYRKGTFTFTYNTGNTKIKNRRGHDTTVFYNGQGNPAKIADPSGLNTLFEYDGKMNLTRVTDADGNSDFTYDANGNISTIKSPTGLITSYAYETQNNQITTITDPLGHAMTYAYDASGNLTKTTDPTAQDTLYEYYSNGKLKKITAPGSRVTEFQASTEGYLTEIKDTVGTDVYTLSLEYNSLGDVTKITRPDGTVLTNTYNAMKKITGHTRTSGSSTKTVQYTYNKGGNITKATENSYDRTFTYDNLWITKISYPGGGSVSYTFSGNDFFTSVTDGNGTTSYAYDTMDRVTGITYPDASTLALTYVNDYMTQIAGSGMDMRYTYDAERRLVKIKDAIANKEFAFAYNDAGFRTEMTDANAGKTTYAYDALDRLTDITDPNNQTTTFTTPVAGKGTTILNDIINAYNHNENNKLVNLITEKASGDIIANYNFEIPDIRFQTKTIEGAKRWYSWVVEEAIDKRGMNKLRSPFEILR